MRDLNFAELQNVSGVGAVDSFGYGVGYAIGGGIRGLNSFGHWLGGAIYDWSHP